MVKNNRKKNQENQFITLREAAEIYGCTQKHMNLMARQGKLKAEKMGRNWLTKKDWLDEYKNNFKPEPKNSEKYISLGEAAKAYGCTQRHLNLMARQGKLKATKMGRNWVTTFKWLEDYTSYLNGEKRPFDFKKLIPSSKPVLVILTISFLLLASIGLLVIDSKKQGSDISARAFYYAEKTTASVSSFISTVTSGAKNIFTFNALLPYQPHYPQPTVSKQTYLSIKDLYKKLREVEQLASLTTGDEQTINEIKQVIINEAADQVIKEITITKPIETVREIIRETIIQQGQIISYSGNLDIFKQELLTLMDEKLANLETTIYQTQTTEHNYYYEQAAMAGGFNTVNNEVTFNELATFTSNLTVQGITNLASTSISNYLSLGSYLDFSAIATPSAQAGRLFRETTDNSLWYYDGSDWMDLTEGTGSGGGLWTQTGSNIYYTTGYVGVGDGSPDTYNFSVDGTASISDDLYVGDKLLWVDVSGNFVSMSNDLYVDGTAYFGTNTIAISDHIDFGSLATPSTADGRLYFDSDTSQLLLYDGSGWQNLASTSIAPDGSVTQNYVAKWVDSDTLTNSIIFDDGNSVGINDIVPGYTLSVDGTASISDDFYFGNDMIFGDVSADNIYSSASYFVEDFTIDGNASISGYTDYGGIATPSVAEGRVFYSAVNDALWMHNGVSWVEWGGTGGGGGADSDWQISGGDLYSLVAGNIGIGDGGAMSPNYKLSVDGTASISDDFYFGNNMIFGDVSADNIYSSASWFLENTSIDGTASISGATSIYGDLTVYGTFTGDGAVASDSIDFDEIVDSATLDNNWVVGGTSYYVSFPHVSASDDLSVTNQIKGGTITDGTFSVNSGTITGATWSGNAIDISGYTNLGVVGDPLDLIGDNLDIHYASASGGGYLTVSDWSDFYNHQASTSEHINWTAASSSFFTTGNLEVDGTASISDDITISDWSSGTSTYNSISDWFNTTQSAGKISGGVVSDNGDGTITITAGTGIIKKTDSATGEDVFFDWIEDATLEPKQDETNYIYYSYSTGAMATTSAITDISFTDEIALAVVYNDGTYIHTLTGGVQIQNSIYRVHKRLEAESGFARVSGMVITENGTRGLDMTAGTYWRGLTELSATASTSMNWTAWYNDGTWQSTVDQKTISNTQYNDYGTGLDDIAANQYGVHYVYRDYDGNFHIIYGIGSYTLSEALAAGTPANLPTVVSSFSIFIAKIIVKKDATNFYGIYLPWDDMIGNSAVTDHGALGGLTDDDHTQYLLTDGTRALTGDWIAGAYGVYSSGSSSLTDLTIDGTASISGTLTATTITDGTFSVTGGAITGATGNISLWTNDSGYLLPASGLSSFNDVATSSVGEDELLAYNNTTDDWENQTFAELGLLTTGADGIYSKPIECQCQKRLLLMAQHQLAIH